MGSPNANIWCELIRDSIIDPLFYSGKTNDSVYFGMLNYVTYRIKNCSPPLLSNNMVPRNVLYTANQT